MFEMTESEFEETEQAERVRHDEKVREIHEKDMEVDIEVEEE